MTTDKQRSTSEQVAHLVRRLLEQGQSVEIDGLGRFQPAAGGGFEFVPFARPKIFLAYVEENRDLADRLFRDFRACGYDPWLDRRKLLPGQNWPRAIDDAIATADFFVACFSSQSVGKKGSFQAEIRYALDCARRVPLDETFLIPVRLDACTVPWRIRREVQYIDLFPDWDQGLRRVLAVMGKEWNRRLRAARPKA